ncbi:MAG: hypothetical protein ACO3JL_13775 [Myxococcota bacterium]
MPRFVRRVTRQLEGRFALTAILAFCLFSATFALATAVVPGGEVGQRSSLDEPATLAAEQGVRELLEERLHMHLKRIHSLERTAPGMVSLVR